MNYSRLALAALGGTVASFAVGFLILWLVPALFEEAHKYTAVFRPREQMNSVAPIGFIATFVMIIIVAIIFAMTHQTGVGAGARLGILFAIFAICNVAHNYMNLNIGMKLAAGQAAAYFMQWIVTGIVIGLIYKPAGTP